VAYFEADSGRVLTIERVVKRLELGSDACWERSRYEPTVQWRYGRDDSSSWCEEGQQTLHQLRLTDAGAELVASFPLDGDGWFSGQTAITNERVFVKQHQLKEVTENGYTYWTNGAERLHALDESLRPIETVDVSTQVWGWGQLRARGTRAFSEHTGSLQV